MEMIKAVWNGNPISSIEITDTVRRTLKQVITFELTYIAEQFYNHTGKWLFGPNHSNLDECWSGSTRLVLENLEDKEFLEKKKFLGDIDVMFPLEYKKDLNFFLANQVLKDLMFNDIEGSRGHGNEISLFVRGKKSKKLFQIDFEGVEFHEGKPQPEEVFLHSSSLIDAKNGIKGVHHKLLLNAIATVNSMKFSITHGLRFRDENIKRQWKTPEEISVVLFPLHRNHWGYSSCHYPTVVESFVSLVNGISQYSLEERLSIYDKFIDSCNQLGLVDSKPAIDWFTMFTKLK